MVLFVEVVVLYKSFDALINILLFMIVHINIKLQQSHRVICYPNVHEENRIFIMVTTCINTVITNSAHINNKMPC